MVNPKVNSSVYFQNSFNQTFEYLDLEEKHGHMMETHFASIQLFHLTKGKQLKKKHELSNQWVIHTSCDNVMERLK